MLALRGRTRILWLAAVSVLIALLAAYHGLRAGDDVFIPAGYTGWVVIRYGERGSSPLKRSWLRPVINIPWSGIVSTSSSRPAGYGIDRYYFVNEDGKRRLIQSEARGCTQDRPCVQKFEYYSKPRQVTVFFVGKARDIGNFERPVVRSSSPWGLAGWPTLSAGRSGITTTEGLASPPFELSQLRLPHPLAGGPRLHACHLGNIN